MEVERRITYALGKKPTLCEKELITFITYYILSNIRKMCLPSSCIMLLSSRQLPAGISVLLAAITHITQAFYQHNKHSPQVTFSGRFCCWLGECPLGSKLISMVRGCNKNVLVFNFLKSKSPGGRLFQTKE